MKPSERLPRSAWPPKEPSGAPARQPVYAARYERLTTSADNKLTPSQAQAQAVLAATILRHLHAIVSTDTPWDADIATHGSGPRRRLEGRPGILTT